MATAKSLEIANQAKLIGVEKAEAGSALSKALQTLNLAKDALGNLDIEDISKIR